MKKVGLIGFGRIGSSLYDKINATEDVRVSLVYEMVEELTKNLDSKIIAESPDDFFNQDLDLVIEAADFRAVSAIAPKVLEGIDMLILSASGLADEKVEQKLYQKTEKNKTKFYIPHGALLGMDGFQDARTAFDEITITTVKPPKNLDYRFQDKWNQDEITERTVLYDGTTREVCKMFPRNVNAHAVLAISSLGFDRTKSVLIADPESKLASHHIVAKGGDSITEIIQSSPIKGVTGEFTLLSVYGTILRILQDRKGLNII